MTQATKEPPTATAPKAVNNGTAKPILSREEGLIDAEVIDSVSEDLAIQFDKMLDVRG